jgi:hypothetical protein
MIMNVTKEQIQERLKKLLEIEGVKKGTKKARYIEWAMIQGIALAVGESFSAYYILLLACGRSILDELQ